jgi:hypothetical protein
MQDRYAQLIAVLLVLSCYSAAMPFLNLAGFVCCILQYWTDKLLFLREYVTPRRYSKELTFKAVNLIEFGIVLHLVFGLGMLSNPLTLNYNPPYRF